MITPATVVLLLSVLGVDPPGLEAAREYRQAHAPGILRDYVELLEMPNVVQYDLHHPDLGRNARWIVEQLRERGVTANIRTLGDAPPIVLGSIDVPDAQRTIGLYIHYDGQPVDADAWRNGPWTPTLYDRHPDDSDAKALPLPGDGDHVDGSWRLCARAVADDKTPIMALLAALDALRAADLEPTVNVRILMEGEEEAGSPDLDQYLRAYRRELDADPWLIFDGPTHQSGRPQLVFGVRGITSMDITVYGAVHPLHSGHYGNWAPNPSLKLARLLAGMKDADDRVTITGFYDGVRALTPAERAAVESVPDIDEMLLRRFGLAASEGGRTLVEALLEPTLNIRGLDGGPAGDKARNVIPTSASAALDIRLVPGNDPTRMLDLVEDHVRRQGYHVIHDPAELTPKIRRKHADIALLQRGGGYRAVRVDMDHPAIPGLRAAAGAASGQPVVMMPTLGGSLPLYLFEEILDAPPIIVPIANYDNNQHGPNENLRLANLWYGVDLMAVILSQP